MAKVTVRYDETLEDALRRFKKQVEMSGVMQKLREKEYFVGPAERKRLKAVNARKNRRQE